MVVLLLFLGVCYAPLEKQEMTPSMKTFKGLGEDRLGRNKSLTPPPPMFLPPPPRQRDAVKEVLTYGSVLSVLVNLINLLSKIVAGFKWAIIRRIGGL
jgi:hypothetical protein